MRSCITSTVKSGSIGSYQWEKTCFRHLGIEEATGYGQVAEV